MLELNIQPRFSETDALGHINNAVIPVWFEQARTPIFELFVPDLNPQHWNLILARVEVDYLQELFYQAPVTIKTGIDRIGEKSVRVYQEVWQHDACAAKGMAVLVHFDHQNKCSQPIPDDVRAALRPLLLGSAS